MSITLTWFGHNAFLFEADGHSVLLDPFISGNPLSKTDIATLEPETIILTHAHNDHVGDTVDIATRSGSTVIATFELANYLGSKGVRNTIGGNHGGTIEFPGGSTKLTPAWHTSSYSEDGQVVAPGVPAGHVIRFGDKTIYAAGDTCVFLDMQLIADEGLDVAILPIGDHFTMGPGDALKAVKMLRAGTVIPSHYNTFQAIEQDPEAFKQSVESETASEVLVPRIDERTELQ